MRLRESTGQVLTEKSSWVVKALVLKISKFLAYGIKGLSPEEAINWLASAAPVCQYSAHCDVSDLTEH